MLSHISSISIFISESEEAKSADGLASLTALERTDWARKRTKYLGSGINKESLDILEKAAFIVSHITTSN